MGKIFVFLFVASFGVSLAQETSPIENTFNPSTTTRSDLTCVQQKTETLTIPVELMPKARAKAKLITLLRESIEDDAQGKVDLKKEKEIRKLFKELE